MTFSPFFFSGSLITIKLLLVDRIDSNHDRNQTTWFEDGHDCLQIYIRVVQIDPLWELLTDGMCQCDTRVLMTQGNDRVQFPYIQRKGWVFFVCCTMCNYLKSLCLISNWPWLSHILSFLLHTCIYTSLKNNYFHLIATSLLHSYIFKSQKNNYFH